MTAQDVRTVCSDALAGLPLEGKRVLVLIPDHTRHAPIGLFFGVLYDILGSRVAALDVLVATGTHAPMEPDRLYRHLGITPEEHRRVYRNVRLFNHEPVPSALISIGEISGEEISRLTDGAFSTPVAVTVNRKVVEYEHIIVVSPVVPHETMGFAGGNKYFFPGIAGREVVETFHWLGALITNPAVNGVKDTPTRRVIDRAAEFITTPRTCLAFVVDHRDEVACLVAGDMREAWSQAVDVAARIHITYTDRPYTCILAITPPIYEELWVGGKAVYKLEPVVADGGEIVVYGPQIRTLSFVHEREIRRLGYHVIGYFTEQWERFSTESRLIMAHSSNVRGIGTYERGVEHPRITVTLATSIPEEVCRSVNLGYRDFRTIDPGAWRSRAHEGTLVVENAGQSLYRLGTGTAAAGNPAGPH